MDALIMAGGSGSRMGKSCEKPLIKVLGKPMVEWVVKAVMESGAVSRAIVTVTRRTVKTGEEASKLPVEVMETPGLGYIEDYKYAIKKLKLSEVLILPSDLPLIRGGTLREVVDHYRRSGKPALSVAVPLNVYEKLNLRPEYVFEVNGKLVSPAGVNVIDGRRVDEEVIEEEVLVMDKEELAVNVNTFNELKLAEKLMRKASFKSSPRDT